MMNAVGAVTLGWTIAAGENVPISAMVFAIPLRAATPRLALNPRPFATARLAAGVKVAARFSVTRKTF